MKIEKGDKVFWTDPEQGLSSGEYIVVGCPMEKEEYPYYDFDNDLSRWKYTIPYEERMHQFHFERDNEEIEKMHEKVIKCREFMNKNLFKIGDLNYADMIKKGNALRELLKNRI